MSFKISFNKCKWFLVNVYKPPKIGDECTLNVLSKFADEFVGSSNVCVFFGDINCDMFKENILWDLCDVDDIVWAHEQLVTSVIDSHAPLKQRCIKTIKFHLMNATLWKAIHQRNMWRSRHFWDKQNTTAREKYVFWRNNVVKLTKSSVNVYFSKQCSGPMNTKQFFKIVRPFINNKANQNGGNTIMLRENNRIITDISEVAEIFNVFYSSISNYPVNSYDGLDDANIRDVVARNVLFMRMKVLSISNRAREN